ncbi:MAG: hypothetical protein U1E65_35745 [Myxococcota bacterium]
MRLGLLLLCSCVAACATTRGATGDAAAEDRPADKDGPKVELWAGIDGVSRPILMDLETRLHFGSSTELVGIARLDGGVRSAVLHAVITLHCAPPGLPAALTTHAFEFTTDDANARAPIEAELPSERRVSWTLDLAALAEECDRRGLEIADVSGAIQVVALSAADRLGRSPRLGFWAK